jgi:hypothetical protein
MNKPTAGWAMRRNLMAHGLNDPLECFKIAPQYSLKGIEDRISCPTFVCSAGDDDLSVDAGKLYDALTCPKRYYQFPSAKAPGSTAKAAPGPCSTPSPSTGSARCSTPPRACRLRN